MWHLERRLQRYLFADPDLAELHRTHDPVTPVSRSQEGKRKISDKTSDDDHPLHSLRTLLDEMATLTRTTLRIKGSDLPPWDKDAVPSQFQRAVFEAAKSKVV